MFTGIVTDIGIVRDIEKSRGDLRLWIETSYDLEEVDKGSSIACSGCCLTVVDKLMEANTFAVDVSEETLSKTTLRYWQKGTRVNLERSMCVGDELGGHLVSGHVDGVAELVSVVPEGDSHRCIFKVENKLALFFAPKGSVALGGVSLTVNEVIGNAFGINIIPYTWKKTTIGGMQVGDKINVEVDILARYVAKMIGKFPDEE